MTPAKHLEALRAGTQDYAYLVMLDRAVRELEKKHTGGELFRRGRSLLKSAVDRVLRPDGSLPELSWLSPKDRARADRVRVEIGRWLARAAAQRSGAIPDSESR